MATELVTDQYPPDSMEIPPELNVKPSSVDEEKLGKIWLIVHSVLVWKL